MSTEPRKTSIRGSRKTGRWFWTVSAVYSGQVVESGLADSLDAAQAEADAHRLVAR
jgi:hypothetical protein